jgi:hypothetical protein
VALALLDESSAQHEAVLADVEELWESYAHDTPTTPTTRTHADSTHDICTNLTGVGGRYVRLVYTHSEREATPPGKLRGLLERALRLFPSHRLFLSLYIHWEARTRIEGRLRRFFDDTLQRQNHPVLWLFAIRSEVVRLGSAHRIRSLFERALEKTSEYVPSHRTRRTRTLNTAHAHDRTHARHSPFGVCVASMASARRAVSCCGDTTSVSKWDSTTKPPLSASTTGKQSCNSAISTTKTTLTPS